MTSPKIWVLRDLSLIMRKLPARPITPFIPSGRGSDKLLSRRRSVANVSFDASLLARSINAQLNTQKNLSGAQLPWTDDILIINAALTNSLGPLNTNADFSTPSLTLARRGASAQSTGRPSSSRADLMCAMYALYAPGPRHTHANCAARDSSTGKWGRPMMLQNPPRTQGRCHRSEASLLTTQR